MKFVFIDCKYWTHLSWLQQEMVCKLVEKQFYIYFISRVNLIEGSPCGIVNNKLECDIVVSKFNLHFYYYTYFWTNIFGKGMNPFILPTMG